MLKRTLIIYFLTFSLSFLYSFSKEETEIEVKSDSIIHTITSKKYNIFDSTFVIGQFGFVLKNDTIREGFELILQSKEKRFRVKTDKQGVIFFTLPADVDYVALIAIEYKKQLFRLFPIKIRIGKLVNNFIGIDIFSLNFKTENYSLFSVCKESKDIEYLLKYFIRNYPENKYLDRVYDFLQSLQVSEKVEELIKEKKFKKAEELCISNLSLHPDSRTAPFLLVYVALQHINSLINSSKKEEVIIKEIKRYLDISKDFGDSPYSLMVYFFVETLDEEIKIPIKLYVLKPYLSKEELLKLKYYSYWRIENYKKVNETLDEMEKSNIKIDTNDIMELLEDTWYKKNPDDFLLFYKRINYNYLFKEDKSFYTLSYVGILKKKGKEKEAREYTLKVINDRLKRKNTYENFFTLIKLAIDFKFYNKFDTLFNKAINTLNSAEMADLISGLFYINILNKRDVILIFKKYVKLYPEKWFLWSGLGIYYFKVNKYDSSEIYCKRAIELLEKEKNKTKIENYKHHFSDILFMIFEGYIKRGDKSKALSVLKEYIKKYPEIKKYIEIRLRRKEYKEFLEKIKE